MPSLTLPPSMTVEDIKLLNAFLDQRRVLIEFRDADPGTLTLVRENDPQNMRVSVRPGKIDTELRGLVNRLVSDTEEELKKLGIDTTELAAPPRNDDLSP